MEDPVSVQMCGPHKATSNDVSGNICRPGGQPAPASVPETSRSHWALSTPLKRCEKLC
jgi:hypothetical protein